MRKLKLIFNIIFFLLLFVGNTQNLFSNNTLSEFEFQISSDDERIEAIKKILQQGNTKEALESLYVLLKEATIKKDNSVIFQANLLLADIYRDNGDYKKSTAYLENALKSAKDNRNEIQIIYFKKGGNFQNEGEIDSALVNYEKAIFIGDKLENNHDFKAKSHANLSGIYYLKANYPKAIEHSKIAIEHQRIIGNKEIEAGILNNLGGI